MLDAIGDVRPGGLGDRGSGLARALVRAHPQPHVRSFVDELLRVKRGDRAARLARLLDAAIGQRHRVISGRRVDHRIDVAERLAVPNKQDAHAVILRYKSAMSPEMIRVLLGVFGVWGVAVAIKAMTALNKREPYTFSMWDGGMLRAGKRLNRVGTQIKQ